jgi:hypothetical protein
MKRFSKRKMEPVIISSHRQLADISNGSSSYFRVLLHGAVATTLVTCILPVLISKEQLHPCRQANFGWRIDCQNHHIIASKESGEIVFDWTATFLNIGGFMFGGFLTSLSKHQKATKWLTNNSDSIRSGFLGGLMSFPYIIMTGAHISIGKRSYLYGALYIFLVLVVGTCFWMLGHQIGRENGFTNLILRKIREFEMYVSTHKTPSSILFFDVIEESLLVSFIILSWLMCRNLETPMDVLDPDFVKFHSLSWPLGAQLVLNIVCTWSGLIVSSLM